MTATAAEAAGLVTVILPTYNRAATLNRAIHSVLRQEYANLELIVVDDGSTDDTPQIVAAIRDPRLRFARLEANGGASRARNAGMRLARGQFIAFQDSDDEWLGDKLARQVAAAQATGSPDVTVFHTKILYGRDASGRYGPHRVCCLPDIPAPADTAALRQEMHRINIISPQALLFTRSLLSKVGEFDEALPNNNDWDFGIKLMYASDVVFIDEPLVMTFLQTDSISKNMRRGVRAQLRIMRRLNRYSDVRPQVMGDNYARIGWDISKLGKPGLARRALYRAVTLSPRNRRNWLRLVVSEVLRAMPRNLRPAVLQMIR